jgi:hypothetical protein
MFPEARTPKEGLDTLIAASCALFVPVFTMMVTPETCPRCQAADGFWHGMLF